MTHCPFKIFRMFNVTSHPGGKMERTAYPPLLSITSQDDNDLITPDEGTEHFNPQPDRVEDLAK